ncbi:MAG: hypothetical protein A2298_04875 [Gammaproteobacteria bacterium RIFOXYB2_FULL_38_6]|nr:MAG: hypothetical protein A2298_04875 [Gammaproteobacteria bacterium RIFOXYB2_FULL_38_6]
MKKLIQTLLSLSLGFFIVSSQATSLVGVYRQAIKNDPTFKEAYATWMSARENVPIARANLLPDITITGGLLRNYATGATQYYNSGAFGLTITQPIFNFAAWKNYSQAKASVRASAATYAYAAQDLMFRTASAYFQVLAAYDNLRYTLANKKAVHRQLVTAQQQFHVGLIAITGVYDAQAQYDAVVAQEISDRNSLNDRLEDLRAITGNYYVALSSLIKQAPLITPKPADIDAWVKIAEQQNYELQAQENTMLAAKENIMEQAAASWPTLNAVGNYARTYYHDYTSSNATSGNLGVSLNFPIIQGGAALAKTKQARFDYLNAAATLEYQHRTVVDQTRQAYLGIVSGISKVQADVQLIRSKQKQVESTQAGYTVGTRTMVDVLNALSQLYQAQQQYSVDQYTYIINLIQLKELAGTLSDTDLAQINGWLQGTMNVKQAAAEPKTTANKTTSSTKTKTTSHKTSAAKTKTVSSSSKKATQANNYAIQVFASSSQHTANWFAKQYPALHLQVIHSTVRGKTWYKVIQPGFASHAQAQTAIQKLPQDLRSQSPWVIKIP